MPLPAAIRWTRALPALAATLALALLPACGSDDSGPAGPAGPQAVSGTVTKGPVAGAAVTILSLSGDSLLEELAGPLTTDADGAWSGELPAGASGPYFLVATGGSYTDEASGATVDIGSAQLAGYSESGSGPVTPFTHTIWLAVEARADAGRTTVQEDFAAVIAAFAAAFGFDPTTTIPSISGTTEARTYVALLGGLSGLLHDHPALSGLAGVQPITLVFAFVRDLSDGVLDGQDANGAILVPTDGGGFSPLPALDPFGIGPFVDAVNAYAAGTPGLTDIVFGPIDLDFGGSGSGTGSGSVVFSGPGASLLTQTTLVPIAFSESGPALAWSGLLAQNMAVAIGIARSATDASRASIVTVSAATTQIGYGWSAFAFEQGAFVPGVTISGNTVTFDDVVLAGNSNTQLSLTINGTLGE